MTRVLSRSVAGDSAKGVLNKKRNYETNTDIAIDHFDHIANGIR